MGNFLSSDVEERSFCTVPVCLGEMNTDREEFWNLGHNFHKFFLLRMKKEVPDEKTPNDPMFHSLHLFTPPTYQPPPSEGDGETFFATSSFVERKLFDHVPFLDHGIRRRQFLDSGRVWPNYQTWELFCEDDGNIEAKAPFACSPPLPYEKAPSGRPVTHSPDKVLAFASSSFVAAPCVPTGRSRVAKLGSLSPFRKLEERAGPLSVL